MPDNTGLDDLVIASRQLGADKSLVMHGGGNTSLKVGDVLYVKGTGSDLACVNESSFTPLHLPAARAVLAAHCDGNAAMMQALEGCLVHRPAPKPSIETLMHAGLPQACVMHTHASTVLAALNVAEIEAVHARVFGELAPLVAYQHSGHALARACMDVFEAHATNKTIGLMLAYHGMVGFGDTVGEAYGNMMMLVQRAEDYLQAQGAWALPAAEDLIQTDSPARLHVVTTNPLLPSLAGEGWDGGNGSTVLSAPTPTLPRANNAQGRALLHHDLKGHFKPHPAADDARPAALDTLHHRVNAAAGKPLVCHAVNNARTRAFAARDDLADISQYGPSTPQHAVYTRRMPLIDGDVAGFAARYRAYLAEHLGAKAAKLDAAPRIALNPAFGLAAFGESERHAAIAAEMYQRDIDIITRASAHGRYRSAPPWALALAEYEYGGHGKT